MARGGRRGKPGKAYGNRTDLNTAPSGGQYGDKAAAQARLDAVPIQPAPQVQPVRQPLVAPGLLTRPTERPSEPVTSGLATGPGPGPEVLGLGGPLDELRALYRAFPYEELREAIEELEG